MTLEQLSDLIKSKYILKVNNKENNVSEYFSRGKYRKKKKKKNPSHMWYKDMGV